MSNLQSGIWTFLFFTLVGPFFAAVGTVFIFPALMFLQLGPFADGNPVLFTSNNGPAVDGVLFIVATIAVQAYVWAAIPAALSGLAFAVIVALSWPSGWAVSGITGVIGFMIAILFIPFEHGGLLSYIAFAAGLIAVACRAVLVKARVLKSDGIA